MYEVPSENSLVSVIFHINSAAKLNRLVRRWKKKKEKKKERSLQDSIVSKQVLVYNIIVYSTSTHCGYHTYKYEEMHGGRE